MGTSGAASKQDQVICDEHVLTVLENLNHLTPTDLKDQTILKMIEAMACDEKMPADVRTVAANHVRAAKYGVRSPAK